MISLKKLVTLLAYSVCLGTVVSCQNQAQADFQKDISQAALLSVACASCHSKAGMGVPKLTNLSEDRIAKYLTYYKSDEDGTSVMHRLSRGLTQDDIRLIAEYFGQDK